MYVFVYMNNHERLFSIKHHVTDRVIAHASEVLLEDASFKVSSAGRAFVIKNKRKIVHAGVRGTLRGFNGTFTPKGMEIVPSTKPTINTFFTNTLLKKKLEEVVSQGTKVKYNPYLNETFIKVSDGSLVEKASLVGCRMFNNKYPEVYING